MHTLHMETRAEKNPTYFFCPFKLGFILEQEPRPFFLPSSQTRNSGARAVSKVAFRRLAADHGEPKDNVHGFGELPLPGETKVQWDSLHAASAALPRLPSHTPMAVFIQNRGQKYSGNVLVQVCNLNLPFLLPEGSDPPAS